MPLRLEAEDAERGRANAAIELGLTERNRVRQMLEHESKEHQQERQKAAKLTDVVKSVQIESERLGYADI